MATRQPFVTGAAGNVGRRERGCVPASVGSMRIATSALLMFGVAACSSGGGDPTFPPPGAPPPSAAPPAAATPPAAPLPLQSESPLPSALFVLGDSLSDVGNAAATADYLLHVPLDPPTVGLCNPYDVLVQPRRCDDLFYRQSRVADGPLAVEHLAARFALGALKPSLHLLPNLPSGGTNYAVASAKARGPGDEDLARQVEWLLLDHAPLPSDAIYVIMIGGNDAIDALQADAANLAARPPPSAAIVTSAVAAIANEAERLLDFGARRLIVANVPDLATLPAVRVAARASGDEAAVLAAARAISVAFDRELDSRLDAIEASGRFFAAGPAAILRFDLYTALNVERAAVEANGANAVDACFESETYRNSSTAERIFAGDCAPRTVDGTPRFAGFAFFDGIHPTGATHAGLGEALGALF
jgi:phospholipase/lecithinase/hemolysin